MANSPSVARSRACTTPTRNSCARIPSTILDRLAAMGISREVAEKVLAAIRADAAASGSGKARTARVIAALAAQGIEAHAPAIKILAGSIGIETERGPEKGEGTPSGTGGRMGGRPLGRTDMQVRRPRSDAGQRRVEVTPERALAAYEETKAGGAKGSLRRAGESLGISQETVRYLVAAARQKLITDGN